MLTFQSWNRLPFVNHAKPLTPGTVVLGPWRGYTSRTFGFSAVGQSHSLTEQSTNKTSLVLRQVILDNTIIREVSHYDYGYMALP